MDASIAGSLCFGVYEVERQVGFARVITDYATFAYLADVFIPEAYQGQSLGKQLIQKISTCPDLAPCAWTPFTKDVHGLYERFGFERAAHPERLMRRKPVETLPLLD